MKSLITMLTLILLVNSISLPAEGADPEIKKVCVSGKNLSLIVCACYAENLAKALVARDRGILLRHLEGEIKDVDFEREHNQLANFEGMVQYLCEKDSNYSYNNSHNFKPDSVQRVEDQLDIPFEAQ